MPSVRVDAVVRLKEDIPSPPLRCGAKGVVLSVWLSLGGLLCEVEFGQSRAAGAVRALVRTDQLEIVP